MKSCTDNTRSPGLSLVDLLVNIPVVDSATLPSLQIHGIQFDSRRVQPGDLFIAIPGTQADGCYFIADAIAAGAVAIVSEQPEDGDFAVPYFQVPDAREACSRIAANFYRNPTSSMTVVGVTGTNGKTTTAYLLQSILEEAFGHCGIISTVQYETGVRDVSAPNTTPNPVLVQELFAEMHRSGYRAGVMEVSSHALVQHRVTGVEFDAAVFTNLSGDHLDYHGSMEAYRDAKGLFFQRLDSKASAVLNLDRPEYGYLADCSQGMIMSYSMETKTEALCSASIVRMDARGLEMFVETPVGNTTIQLNLVGRYNAENALAAVTAALQCGVDLDVIKRGLQKLKGVPGRVQTVGQQTDFSVVVDYAHTDDALANVLRGLREVTPGRLICVFGCGGDRDTSKRARMGKVAQTLTDFAVVTSDNPRTEDPQGIVQQIVEGMSEDESCRLVISDRTEAIHAAIAMAKFGDTVLIAGKGHETYQVLADGIVPFDDCEVAEQALKEKGKGERQKEK